MPHGKRKFDPARRAYLDSPERRAILDPDAILKAFGVRAPWRFVDVGAGVGFFSFPAARLVGPRGRVVAVDLAPEMLEELQARIAHEGATNMEALLSTEDRLPLDDGSADFAFLACVLHELDGPATLLECRRVLKKAGRLGVVDWKKVAQDIGPPKEHRLDPRQAKAVLADAGFRAIRTFATGPHHYGIEARVA